MSKKQRDSENSSWRERIKWGIYDVRCSLHHKLHPASDGKKTATLRKSRIYEKLFIAAVLFIPLTIFCVFYIGVNINSIFLAFQEYNPRTGDYDCWDSTILRRFSKC